MGRVGFGGRSYAQLRALPPEVQVGFEWAILELAKDPSSLPTSTKTTVRVSTEVMDGPLGLRRVKVARHAQDPGFRGVYCFDGSRAVFLRFAFRDRDTYKRLDRELRRLLAAAALPVPEDDRPSP